MAIGNLNTSRRDVTTPVGTFADKLMQYGQQQEQIRRQDQQLAKEEERFQTNLGFKQRAEDRGIEETQLKRDKELAHNEALKVIFNPEKFSSKAKEEILSNPLVSQDRIFDTKSALYKHNVLIPGTAENTAKTAADRAELKYEGDLKYGYDVNLLGKRQTFEARQQNQRIGADNARHNSTLRSQTSLRNSKLAKEKAELAQTMQMMGLSNSKTGTRQNEQNKAQIALTTERQNEYSDARSKFLDTPSMKNRLEKLYSNITSKSVSPEVKEASQKEFDILNDTAHKYALGVSGSGTELKAVPKKVMDEYLRPKTAQEMTNDVIGILGNNPTIAGSTMGAERIKALTNTEASEMNRLTKAFGVPSINSSNPKVAAENLTLGVSAKRAEETAKASRLASWRKGVAATDKTFSAIDKVVKDMGSPDVVGQGDRLKMESQIIGIKDIYNVSDIQMAKYVRQATPKYNSTVGVDEESYVKELARLAKAGSNEK